MKEITIGNHVFFFYRDSTKLGHAAAGSRKLVLVWQQEPIALADNNSTPMIARYDYFDTPATTSTITYKCGVHPCNC